MTGNLCLGNLPNNLTSCDYHTLAHYMCMAAVHAATMEARSGHGCVQTIIMNLRTTQVVHAT